MSFAEAYEGFKIYASKRHKKQSFECLLYNFNANILSYFKDYALEDITTINIMKWQDFILNKNFCNNHNKNLFAMLKTFLQFCSKLYGFDYSIIDDVPKFSLKVEERKTDFYTLNEFKKFIKFIEDNVYKQFFNLMFFTGTRPGEAMALRFSDLQGEFIRINKTIDSHGNREIGTPKTISSNRVIKLDYKLKKDLLLLHNYYIEKYQDNTFDYFIFGGKKPLAPTTINRYKKDACLKANIRPITLHQFRHSHATLLFNLGVDIHIIQIRLGHSKPSTTIDVYTHSNFKQEKRVCNTLNQLRFNFFECLLYNFKNLISLLKQLVI